jgi:hypothetical protein
VRSRAVLGVWSGAVLFVALVASTPGSPFSPKLPPGAGPGGPLRRAAEGLGLDRLAPNALAALGVASVALAAAAFALALRAAWRGGLSARAVVGLAIAGHALVLLLPLLFSRDVYSYAIQGRILAVHHGNPYVVTAADVPTDPLYPYVGPKWADTPSVYGPLWVQISAGIVRIARGLLGQILAFRLLAAAASLATLAVIGRSARALAPERRTFALAAFGLNPVVLFQSVASGHNDLLVALAVASGLALLAADRRLAATAALALGALVKATAAVPLVLGLVVVAARAPRGRRLRALAPHVGLAGVIGLALAGPFLNRTDPTLGMLELATHEGWLAPSRLFRRALDGLSGGVLGVVPRVVFPLVLLGALVLIGRALARRAGVGPVEEGAAWAWGLLALMLLGPVLLPWYVTWALPLAALLPRVPRTVLVGTGLALAVSQWTSEPGRFPAAYGANVWFGHYVLTPVIVGLLGWLLLDLGRRARSGLPLADPALAGPAGEPREVPAAARED